MSLGASRPIWQTLLVRKSSSEYLAKQKSASKQAPTFKYLKRFCFDGKDYSIASAVSLLAFASTDRNK